jgi:hypothetical protein
LTGFLISTGSGFFSSFGAASTFEQSKTAGGRVLAFSIEWQAGLTAAALHHEHTELVLQEPSLERALQVASIYHSFNAKHHASKIINKSGE